MNTSGSGNDTNQGAEPSSVEETVIFEGAPPTGRMEQPKKSIVGPGMFILIGCVIGLGVVYVLFR